MEKSVKRTNLKTPIFFALVIIFGALLTLASAEPVFNPTLEINRTDKAIHIDADLSDPGWQDAVEITAFVERYPGNNIPPEKPTIAKITYDQNNLYVGFICEDDPALVRATMCQRDRFNGDDAVGVMIDPYGDATRAFEFFVNPYGVQKDYLWAFVHGEDSSFDLIWSSAGKITENGYQVEIAIPFASLRFPTRDIQTWKMDFQRNHPRESYKHYSWSPINQDDQCWVCQWGTVTGIEGVKPGKGIELLPTLTASQNGYLEDYSDPDSKFVNDDADAEFSLGGKYSLTSDLTFEAAYNPDFSQIESDAAQIDVNTTISLFYPERRPFFQEGSDIFRTLFNSFYTRTVNDPLYAAKLVGRSGRYSIGFLSAFDENTPYMIPLRERSLLVNTGDSYVNMLRISRTVGRDNMFGIMVTDRRFDGDGYGTILSFDTDIKLSQQYSIIGQFIHSLTGEMDDSTLSEGLDGIEFDDGKHTAAFDGETFSGGALITQFRRRARNWNFTVDYNHVSPSYRTETGFDPWVDYRNFNIWNGLNFYPENGIIERISPQLWWDNRWDWGGDRKWYHVNLSLNNNLRWAQTYMGISYMTAMEKWSGVEFKNLWDIELYTGSRFCDQIGYEMNISYGTDIAIWLLEKGRELECYLRLDLKPIDRLLIQPTLNYARSTNLDTDEEQYKQTIARVRFQLQANQRLSTRLVLQYNDSGDRWDIDPLLTYRISPFSVFYVGSTHDLAQLTDTADNSQKWKQTSRQLFMKLQYLFRQ